MARKDRGFSLVEVAIVSAIAAITLAIGLPSFNGALERQQVSTTLYLLSADMAMARSSALMRREQVVVCPGTAAAGCAADSDWSRGWLVFADADGNRQPDAPGQLLRATDAPASARSGLRARSTRPFLRYQASGRSAHSNLSVNVCSDGQLHGKVVVNRLGRVRGERPPAGTPCPGA